MPRTRYSRFALAVARLARWAIAWGVACVALAAAANEPPPATSGRVVPIDGKPFEARLVGIKSTSKLLFDDGAKRHDVPLDDLVRWGRPVEPSRGPVAVFVDGGVVPAEPLGIDAGQVVLETDSFGTVRVPLDSLAGLILVWPTRRIEQDRMVTQLLRADGVSDKVVLTNGDSLTGVVAAFDGETLQLDDAGANKLPRARLAAVVFNPALRPRPPAAETRTWVGLDDGTRMLVDRIATEGQSMRLRPHAVADAQWTTETGRCVFIQPLGGRSAYLSDRADDGYRHVPSLELAWPRQTDRNVLGGLLRAKGDLFLKGLGMHSSSRLTYLLNDPVERFEAELALDDRAEGGGSVVYHVFVDRQRRLSSDHVRGDDAPTTIRVDLTGATRLDLIVDFGERADQLDYANWLDARLIRPTRSQPAEHD